MVRDAYRSRYEAGVILTLDQWTGKKQGAAGKGGQIGHVQSLHPASACILQNPSSKSASLGTCCHANSRHRPGFTALIRLNRRKRVAAADIAVTIPLTTAVTRQKLLPPTMKILVRSLDACIRVQDEGRTTEACPLGPMSADLATLGSCAVWLRPRSYS